MSMIEEWLRRKEVEEEEEKEEEEMVSNSVRGEG